MHRLRRELGALVDSATTRSRMRWAMSVQPSLHQVLVGEATGLQVAKLVSHSRCQPGSSWRTTRGRSGGCCARRSTTACAGRRTARRRRRQRRDALHRGGAGADDARPACRRASVIGAPSGRRRCSRSPSDWCGRCGRRRSRCLDAGQLRPVQRTGAHRDEPGRNSSPRSVRMIQRPASSSHSRPVTWWRTARPRRGRSAWRCAGVRVDLGRRHVLLALGTVAGLLEQRQVDHRRGVAHRARVAVPVPGATDVAAALDDPHVESTPASLSRAPVVSPAKPPPMNAT
jgi:hypothetical protein